jgi:hypothetical protein
MLLQILSRSLRVILTPASKVFCPLDFGALTVLPHGQIVGFCYVFRTFDGCINIAINQLRPIRRKDNRAVAQDERLFEAFAGGKAGPRIVIRIVNDCGV